MNAMTRSAVVVGLDRSDHNRAAVEYAAQLASRAHLPLMLIHALEAGQFGPRPRVGWDTDIEGIARRSAQHLVDDTVEVLAAVYPELEVSHLLKVGDPTDLLLEQSHTAHTIVLGSRGTGGFKDLVVGSTTLHVAAHAACPVIAIPYPSDADASRHDVVVGVDGSDLSEAAIGYAFWMAAEVGEKLTAMMAWHDPTRTGVGMMMPLTYNPADVAQEARAALAESLAGWQEKFPDVVVEQKVVVGHPVSALVSHSANARLLVVGCRGRGALRSLVLGSVSHGILHHATGPVAVVHRTA
jgi:nucleotide-binding universal stress UspA family protein